MSWELAIVPKLSKRKLMEVLILISAILIIIIILLFPWSDANGQLGTNDWEEVQATIDISEIREYEVCGEEDCSIQKYPYIRYSYLVDGESFNNNDIVLFDLDKGDYGFSISLVDEYPYDSEATAYYNPEDPNQAVLIKGFSGLLPVINMLLGIIAVVIAAVLIFLIVWKTLFHIQPTSNRQLTMFDVKNWDSKNDAQEIVDWYNKESGENRSVNYFMEICNISKFNSTNDARQFIEKANLLIEQKNYVTSESESISSNSETSWRDEKSE